MSAEAGHDLDAINQYWKAKAHYYYRRIDDALETDSEDSADHLCRPTDPRVVTSESPPKNH